MNVLFIGGTGQISSAIVRKLAGEKDFEVWLLNRGSRMVNSLIEEYRRNKSI